MSQTAYRTKSALSRRLDDALRGGIGRVAQQLAANVTASVPRIGDSAPHRDYPYEIRLTSQFT